MADMVSIISFAFFMEEETSSILRIFSFSEEEQKGRIRGVLLRLIGIGVVFKISERIAKFHVLDQDGELLLHGRLKVGKQYLIYLNVIGGKERVKSLYFVRLLVFIHAVSPAHSCFLNHMKRKSFVCVEQAL